MNDVKNNVTPALQKVLDNFAREIGEQIAKERFGSTLEIIAGNDNRSTSEAKKEWSSLIKALGEHSDVYKNTKKVIDGSTMLRDELEKAVDSGQLTNIKYAPQAQSEKRGTNINADDKSITIRNAVKVEELAYDIGYKLNIVSNSKEIADNKKKFNTGAAEILGGQVASSTRDYTDIVETRLKADARTEASANIAGWNTFVSYKTHEAVVNPNNPVITLDNLAADCPEKSMFFNSADNFSTTKKLSLKPLLGFDRNFMLDSKGINNDFTVNAMQVYSAKKPSSTHQTSDDLSSQSSPLFHYASRLLEAIAVMEENARNLVKAVGAKALGGTELAGYNPKATVVINAKQLGIETGKAANKNAVRFSIAPLSFEDRSNKDLTIKVTVGKPVINIYNLSPTTRQLLTKNGNEIIKNKKIKF
jgi:hypothetical protein